MKIDSIHSLLIFMHVAQAQSFAGAALRLGITPSGASKAVSRLEAKLGLRLFQRTTRHLQLTEDGTALLENCRDLFFQLEHAEEKLANRKGKPAGRLLLRMPVAFGRIVIAPLLNELLETHPDLVIDIHLNDVRNDVVDDDFDVLIRIGSVPQSRLVARKLYDMHYVTVASPGYVKRHGKPNRPEDLSAHHCLAYFEPLARTYRPWDFSANGRGSSVTVPGSLNINNAEALLDAAVRGEGIATVARFIAAEALRLGKVTQLLPGYARPSLPIYLLYPERRYRSPRVHTLVEFLLSRVSAVD
ncbi:MAG TPA: LysR family transcriptional regulator [Bordetella sp.]